MKAYRLLLILLSFVLLISCRTNSAPSSGAPSSPSSNKAITTFSFSSVGAIGAIDESATSIDVTVPFGTNVSSLAATFTTTGLVVTVGAAVQTSGTTVNDFTAPVVYTVTAEDGSSVQYTVTVTQMPAQTAAQEIYAANFWNDSVSVFNAAPDGSEAPLRRIGDATGLKIPSDVAVDTVNNEIFVVNTYSNSITVYERTANGNIAPVRTIAGGDTGLNNPNGLAVDTVNNEIFVVNTFGNSITVYGRTADGNVAPARTIAGENTGLNYPGCIFVDTVNNEIFVANTGGDSITVYDRTGNGNISPMRTISGLYTDLDSIHGMTVDTAHNEIFVAKVDFINVYDSTGSGNITPIRTIIGPNMNYLGGIVADPVNNEIIVANAHANSIVVYARTSNGGFALARTIAGGATGLNNPWGIAVDTIHNQIYAANDIYIANSVGGSITVYDRADSGDVAPARVISYTDTDVRSPTGIAADSVHNEIFVLNFGNNSISVYSRATSGDLSLVRTISGVATIIHRPSAIAVDAVHNEIFVANQPPPITAESFRNFANSPERSTVIRTSAFDDVAPAITVYRRTDNGDVSPIRIISGSSTGLYHPSGVAVNIIRNELVVADHGGVMVFNRTDSGDIAPKMTISYPAGSIPSGIAVDEVNDNIFVTLEYEAVIHVFGRTAAGYFSLIRKISGRDTSLSDPSGIVADTYASTITVYGRTDAGDIAPLRTISGANTGLAWPEGLALW
jgi:DNA-binding beta-propeller fold protein YncE